MTDFFLEYKDILELIMGWGQALLEPGGGSKCNAIADTQYKALTRIH